QVARIDAHRLQRSGSARLCYFGPVLLTQPRQLGGSRSPLQTGAELYGHPGRESDIEIMRLMLEVLHKTGVRNPFLDLGHVGIFRGLVEQAKLNKDLENRLFDALQRKARPEIEELVSEVNDNNVADMFKALIDLNGGEECLAECKKVLVKANKDVLHALDEVEKISASLKQYFPKLRINFDFAELRGYQYHTGVVFAVYSEGHWQALAQGGRYDDVGAAFGSSRPATGFSMDINTLLRVTESRPKTGKGVWAPAADDINLRQTISDLRAKGERVIEELPGIKDTPQELGCDRQLVSQGTQWVIEDLVK
ncbi:MAG: ATP phosphoribosyltransferase regulatory subunit, partial [Gammaproteobacteria bacterium]|nr:ATP phosphoribosyltransferase regulatory subunit [Gammaproteobacteria bacterium]